MERHAVALALEQQAVAPADEAAVVAPGSLVARLQAAGVEARDLDEWVIEQGQHDASRVNNDGLERQVEFLLAHGESAESILGAFGLTGLSVSVDELEEVLRECWQVLGELAQLPAFADVAPQFNEGGIGHSARRRAAELLERRRNHGH